MVSPAAAAGSPSAASGSASKSGDLRRAAAATKQSSGAAASDVSIRLWPPGSRTRSHVAERMADNLKSLSAFYTPLEPDEAVRIAALLEERAYQDGQREDGDATRVSGNRNNGSSAVRIYAKQASKMMLEVLKTGKLPEQEKIEQEGKFVSEEVDAPEVENVGKQEVSSASTAVKNIVGDAEDTASTTSEINPELFDISGGSREVLDLEKAHEVFAPLNDPACSVTKIRLSNWSFRKEAAQFAGILLSKIKDKLVMADLSDIVAGRPEAEALDVMSSLSAALEGSNLKYLNLSNNALGEKGVRAFSTLLKSQKNLEVLVFENNGISHEAADAIVELVSGSNLRTLHFHNNMSGDLGVERLAKLVSQASELEDFRLSSSRMGPKGAVALAEALQAGSSLKRLDLSDNTLGEESGPALGKALKQQPLLTELHFADLGLKDKGVKAVLDALAGTAPNLSVLDLGNNDITARCAPHLADFLKEKVALKKLSLAENELKDKGVIIISNALRQNHDELEELDFTLNEVKSEGAIAAAKAVANKPHFKLLTLESNHISLKGLATVKSILASGVGVSVLGPLEDNEEIDDDEEEPEGEDEDDANEETRDSDELQNRVGGLTI